MLFKPTIAGSLPKPGWLAETEKLWPKWKLEGIELDRAKRDAALIWIKLQEDAGIEIVNDGEQFRTHFVHGFLETVQGIDWNLKTKMGIRNNRYVVEGRIRMGHGVRRREDGTYELAEGWGGAKNVRLEGNEERPQGVDVADWTGPRFDPAHPELFPEFIVEHRAWMEALMRAHFGEPD